ncbi:MAG: FtsQ-type POTRA domain-containing protein [Oscillospiraceae bacterium]|nr:FtsQ-type POTRA domain-containing protein [Oscillospiraceae bacterium]
MPEFTKPKGRKPPPKTQKKPKRPKPQVKERQKAIIAQEPSETNGKQRRKQNMAIYYVMFFVVGIAVFAILAATVLFNLEVVETEGESIYTSEEIIEAANIKAGVNLLRFDTEESRRRIIEQLVYIDDVVIRKNFPKRLTIHVTGAIEMACVEHEGTFYKISRNGRVLETTPRGSDITVIYGYEADSPYIGAYIRSTEERKTDLIFLLMNTARETGLDGIVDVDIEDYLNIRMNYMDRIVLHIGPATQLKDKFEAAAHILTEEIDQNWRGTLRLLDPLEVVFAPE